ncbi:MAG: hypothetical protein WCT14_21245, partial [Treponemataceae bacterium]
SPPRFSLLAGAIQAAGCGGLRYPHSYRRSGMDYAAWERLTEMEDKKGFPMLRPRRGFEKP